MRVLSSLIDSRMGGPQQRSLEVADRLRERDIETVFLVPNRAAELRNTIDDHGFDARQVEFNRIRQPQKVISNIQFLLTFYPTTRRIRHVIDEEEIDIVHANAAVNFQTAKATAESEARLLWHFNDTFMPWPVTRAAAQAARRWADEIIVAAQAVHEHYFAPNVESRIIHAAVDVEEFNPENVVVNKDELKAELGISSDIPVVGTVGNLNPLKGHDHLLRAARSVLDNGREAVFVIVGAPLDSQRRYYRELQRLRSELNLDHRVVFAGWRSDVRELLSLFEVFVLPSVAEACPIVVLEAMAMERPIVATRVGGVPEQLTDGVHGWLVPPRDGDQLGAAICDALDSPAKREDRARKAFRRVRERFSIPECVDRHEMVYRSLVEDHPEAGSQGHSSSV